MDHVGAKVGPARVAGEADAVAEVVQRRNAEVTAARDVDRGEVERLTEQALVQRRRDELVDLVHLLARQAERDGRDAFVGECLRRQERLLQRVAA